MDHRDVFNGRIFTQCAAHIQKVIRDYQAMMDKTNNLLKLWKKTIRVNDERWHKSLDTGQGDDATKDDFQDTKRPEC